MIVVVGLLVVNYFRNIDTGDDFLAGPGVDNEVETTYTVAAGDTLWSIAEQVYGTGYSWVDIRDANNIENPNDIEEGQVLVIPQVGGASDEILADAGDTESETEEAVSTPVAEEEQVVAATDEQSGEVESGEADERTEDSGRPVSPGGSYTVVRGDNLWNIAVAAYGDGYRWTDIAKANNLANPSIIHAGNVLVIPA